jgi:dTDP-glucose 4,6-dehydratase
MRRIAVLGSNSFAGAGFVNAALTAGYELLGVNRSPEGPSVFLPYRTNTHRDRYGFHCLDLNADFEALARLLGEWRPEYVVDFAGQGMVAESWHNPHQWFQTNVVAKSRLHDFLRRQNWLSKYVRISTPEVYGSTSDPIREDAPYAPSTPYAVSHAATDLSLAAYFREFRFPAVIGRFANFFGPGQQLYRIVPRTILYVLAGRKLQLHGGGTSVRAFIHVRDVADGILRMLERGEPGETYHFSPSEFHTIRQVVERVCVELGAEFTASVEIAAERLGKDHAYLMDASKARATLAWAPRGGLVEGIRETIAWVKENVEVLRRQPWDYVHKA